MNEKNTKVLKHRIVLSKYMCTEASNQIIENKIAQEAM